MASVLSSLLSDESFAPTSQPSFSTSGAKVSLVSLLMASRVCSSCSHQTSLMSDRPVPISFQTRYSSSFLSLLARLSALDVLLYPDLASTNASCTSPIRSFRVSAPPFLAASSPSLLRRSGEYETRSIEEERSVGCYERKCSLHSQTPAVSAFSL